MIKLIINNLNLFLLLFATFSVSAQNDSISIMPNQINIPGKKIFSPCISFDGEHLIFVAKSDTATLVMTSEKGTLGNWKAAVEVSPVNDAFAQDYIIESPTLNADGTLVHFSIRKRGSPNIGDIYSVKKEKGKWEMPIKLPTSVNKPDSYQTDPCLSLDGKKLYFSRQYDNKENKDYKCTQIFMARKINGRWEDVQLLPNPVNEGCDRAPRIAADGKTLFISSVRGEENTGMDIYYSKQLADNVWTTPIPVTEINTKEDEIFASIDFSGKKLFFLRGQGKKSYRTEKVYSANLPDIYRPDKMTYLFGKITDLNTLLPIYGKIKVTSPKTSVVLQEIQADEKTGEYKILFEQGIDYRLDFYREGYSHVFYDFSTQQKNLPEKVEKNIQLYTTVNLILNLYDSEIFEPLDAQLKIIEKEKGQEIAIKSKKLGTGRFQLTLPIGKNYDIVAHRKHYASNTFSLNLTRTVQFDEFERDLELSVKKIPVNISLTDAQTGVGVEVDIEITNISTNEKIKRTIKTDKNGKITVDLRDGNKYDISVNPRGYAFYNTTLELDSETETNPKIAATLTPLTTLTKIELKDIIFEFNSADLDNSSFIELERVIKLMKVNPQIKMEISAHTDDVGSQKYNLKLSGKRAESVANFIIGKGITREQLSSKGYGKAEPKYLPENTEENRAKNRRVELKILEIKN